MIEIQYKMISSNQSSRLTADKFVGLIVRGMLDGASFLVIINIELLIRQFLLFDALSRSLKQGPNMLSQK